MEDLIFEDLDAYLLGQNGNIIHQVWFGVIPNKWSARKAFEGLRKYRDSWLLKNPTWSYVCWDINRSYNLVKYYYPQHLEMYKKYPYDIQRCDAVRYFALHRYGGLYADMDYHCNRPWNEVNSNYLNDLYLVETPNRMGNEPHVSNSLMYSRNPGHVFWSRLFIELEQHQRTPIYYSRHMTIMYTTGPAIINRVYNRYKTRDKLSFYPHKLFHPYGLSSDIVTLNNKPHVYAMHVGKGSWESSDSKVLIFLYQNSAIVLFILCVMIIPILVYSIFRGRGMLN